MNRKLYKYTLTLLLKVKGKTFLFFFAILLDLSSDFIFPGAACSRSRNVPVTLADSLRGTAAEFFSDPCIVSLCVLNLN